MCTIHIGLIQTLYRFTRNVYWKIEKIRDTSASSSYQPLHDPTNINMPLLDKFKLVSILDILKIMNSLKASTYLDDTCPAWFYKKHAVTLVADITMLVNKCLAIGLMPTQLKHAIISPLLKKAGLDPANLNNFRPITSIPFLAKILERVVFDQLQHHMEIDNLFHDTQSGFRPGRGTEVCALAMRERLLMIKDAGGSAALVLLDLSAAFDTIDRDILTNRMEFLFGIKGKVLNWLKSFLSNHTHVVCLGDYRSLPRHLHCGVPQGSAISPLAFNCYMRPLPDIILKYGLEAQIYADDTQILVDMASGTDMQLKLQLCLAEIHQWMLSSRLGINTAKTEVLLIGKITPISPISNWPISFGTTPTPAKKIKNLGVWFDSELTFIPHVLNIVKNASYYLYFLRKLKNLFTEVNRKKLVQALILSRLYYLHFFLLNLPKKWIAKLQLVQNHAARLIKGLNHREHVTSSLREHHWLPIAKRAEFKALCLVFKAYWSQGPMYLSSIVSHYTPKRSLRSANQNRLMPKPYNFAAAGGKTLQVFGVFLWNNLPESMRKINSLTNFRKVLKTHLLSNVYE